MMTATTAQAMIATASCGTDGTVDEGANTPLTDPTKTDVDRNPELIPPQDTEPAVPP
jgi:hypothetical protein